jgi:hypothetical protein
MEPKIMCYKPSSAGNYNKRQNNVKIVILNSDKSQEKTKYRRLLLLKLELRRIAVERRFIHFAKQKIICEVHSETFLLPDCGLLKRFVVVGQMKNLASCKKYS